MPEADGDGVGPEAIELGDGPVDMAVDRAKVLREKCYDRLSVLAIG